METITKAAGWLYGRLRRKTNTTKFIPQIDGLRFLAIILVVLFHVNGFVTAKVPFIFPIQPAHYWWLYEVFSSDDGRKGVLLFFVISGFILGMPFAKFYWQGAKKVDLKNYFLRRLTRLEPPYFITMVFCYLALAFFKGHDFTAMFAAGRVGLLPNLASSLVYMHNILYPNIFSVNPVAWSLEIEIQFYILVPLLINIFRMPKTPRRFFLVGLMAVFIYLQHLLHPAVLTLFSFIQYFLLGFLLLDVYLSGWKFKVSPYLTFLMGILSLASILYLDTYGPWYNEYIFIALAFLFFVLVMTDTFWKKLFSVAFFTSIGGMCYSIYLWHDLVMSAVGNKTIFWNVSRSYPATLLWQYCLILPCILAFSTFFYLLIEKPCMDKDWPVKLRRFITRRKTPSV